jgi:hypothetical protein
MPGLRGRRRPTLRLMTRTRARGRDGRSDQSPGDDAIHTYTAQR